MKIDKEYKNILYHVVVTVLVLAVTFGALRYVGVFGERVVFENSFQYKEGMKQRFNTLTAQIAEVDMQIVKTPSMKKQLLAQRKVLEIQLEGVQR